MADGVGLAAAVTADDRRGDTANDACTRRPVINIIIITIIIIIIIIIILGWAVRRWPWGECPGVTAECLDG
jgi:hypothetical protein